MHQTSYRSILGERVIISALYVNQWWNPPPITCSAATLIEHKFNRKLSTQSSLGCVKRNLTLCLQLNYMGISMAAARDALEVRFKNSGENWLKWHDRSSSLDSIMWFSDASQILSWLASLHIFAPLVQNGQEKLRLNNFQAGYYNLHIHNQCIFRCDYTHHRAEDSLNKEEQKRSGKKCYGTSIWALIQCWTMINSS